MPGEEIDIIVRYIYPKIGFKTYLEILCIIEYISFLVGIMGVEGWATSAGDSWTAAAAAGLFGWRGNWPLSICSSSFWGCWRKNPVMATKSSRPWTSGPRVFTYRVPAWCTPP